MHEAAHGVGLGREMRNADALEGPLRSLVLAEPDGEDGLAAKSLLRPAGTVDARQSSASLPRI
jgi:hypothetical protein